MSTSIPKFDKTPLVLALTLTAFATVASILLAVGDSKTRPEIALRLAEDLNAILSQVVPAELHDNELVKDTLSIPNQAGDIITVYRARLDDKIIGFAYPVTAPNGYAGPVKLVMGITAQGEIMGVRVLSHAETPGLGDQIELAKSDWVLSFNGLSFDNLAPQMWKVQKDGGHFDQFSGATITPRIVVQAVKGGVEFFHANANALFKAPAPKPAQEDGAPEHG